MNLRYLVPALGFAALSTTSAFAEDKPPTVTFGGWVDAVVQYSDARQDHTTAGDDTADIAATGKDEGAGSLRFTGSRERRQLLAPRATPTSRARRATDHKSAGG